MDSCVTLLPPTRRNVNKKKGPRVVVVAATASADVRKWKIFRRGRRICFLWVPASAKTKRPPRRGATSCLSNARYCTYFLFFSSPRVVLARLHMVVFSSLPPHKCFAFLPNVELGSEQQAGVNIATDNALILFCLFFLLFFASPRHLNAVGLCLVLYGYIRFANFDYHNCTPLWYVVGIARQFFIQVRQSFRTLAHFPKCFRNISRGNYTSNTCLVHTEICLHIVHLSNLCKVLATNI